MFDYTNDLESGEMICDYCDTTREYDGSFTECIEEAKEDGWIIKKKKDEWFNFCDVDCLNNAMLKGII